MALAKWFGTGPTPASGSGSGLTGPSTTDHAKSALISKAEHKQFGLENFGNTCYANSVLQALYFCDPFRELVLQVVDKSNPPVSPSTYAAPSPSPPPPIPTNPRAKNQRKLSAADVPRISDGTTANGSAPLTGPPIPTNPPTMFSALRALFMHISHNSLEKGTVAPRSFIEKLKKENELFRSTMHQDAHEFLIFLLNKIAEDLEEEARNVRSGSSSHEDLSNSVTSSGPSTLGTNTSGSRSTASSTIVHDLFEGVLTSETRCLTCETVSARDEAFLDLSIDIEQNSSVTACLRQFSASEMLCQKNKFFCDACCGLQEAEKRMKIKRLPNVLALHLKRFKYQEDVQKYIKLAYRVAFPLELRLFNTVDDAQDPDRLYELFAIVVHIGNGPHHGHYIAIIKSNGVWVVFDDDTVDTIKESDISKYFGDSNSGSAYVLYYQALDLDMQALGLKVDEPAPTESAAESSSLRAPLLPPGLTHEGESDTSEIAPTTPASPVLQSVPTIVPPLTVSIPPPQSSSSIPIPVPTPTATSPSPNGKPGFFNSLRHSPSKPSFGQTSRGSVYDSMTPPPMPPLPPSAMASSPQMSSELSEASTSASTSTSTPIAPNGKHKVSKEKSSGWFSRKRSIRIEKEKPPDSRKRPSTAHDTRDRHDTGSFTSSASSSRAPHTREPSPSKRPSTADGHSPSPAFSTPPTSPPPLPSNPTSPAISHNGFPISPTTTTPSLFPHHDSHQNSLFPGHKKSQPVLSSALPNGESRSIPTARPPKRPSTAGAAPSPTHATFARLDEPPPPLPPRSELRPAVPRPRSAANDPSVPQEERDRRRFSTQAPPPSAATTKRASRKLSFTSGMLSLGFSRKDKDKHRNNELSGPLSPTSVNAPSMVHGLSLSGRM